MKSFPRADRVSAQIQKVLAEVLRKKIKDPRLEAVVITAVKMAQDIKSARVYYAVSGSRHAREQAGRGFDDARGYIKRLLAKKLGLRYMPEVRFFYDESIDYGDHIDSLLKTVHVDDETNNTSAE
ncbi:MAG: 30S ribosome-binding factor RbfA [Deltaproteobacteria bacterium]|nr:30S ribosome-binding factor RbfA [Deltaproteobacteria bacterium]